MSRGVLAMSREMCDTERIPSWRMGRFLWLDAPSDEERPPVRMVSTSFTGGFSSLSLLASTSLRTGHTPTSGHAFHIACVA